MRELRPGVWHWQSPHPDWDEEQWWPELVSSYGIELGDDFLLFDPLSVPGELRERATAVVLTAPYHERDARRPYRAGSWVERGAPYDESCVANLPPIAYWASVPAASSKIHAHGRPWGSRLPDVMVSGGVVACPVEREFDPLSPKFLADPVAVMASLPLADRPVFYAPAIDYFVVTRYRDIEAIFSDNESYSAAAAQLPLVELDARAREILLDGDVRPQPSMVSLDQPEHTRLRRPTARAFSARRTAEMEPRIRAILAQLLGAIDPSEPFDLVSSLTFPLPATVVFSFIGVPATDYARLKEWCGYRAKLAWGRPPVDEQVEHARNMTAYRHYLRGLVQAKDGERGDDFASALLAIHDEQPDVLTHEEISSILYSLSFAGHETTNYLISNLLRRLLEEPERWDAVVDDPALIPGAIEETLRYDPSVPAWRRFTKRPVTIAGVGIPGGSKLFLWTAAAGRDPDVFPDPDTFDMRRENARHHLAFGKGIHFCIGSALGKLEARLALEALTISFPGLRLVPGQQLTFHPNISFRGPQELWAQAR